MRSNKPKKALRRRGKSFLFAARGIAFAVKTQPNFCFHLLAILLVTEFGLLYHLEKGQWGLLVVFFCLIPALELVNTALEAVVDLASPDYHPLAKAAKDCAAGAVLVAALGAVAYGAATVLWPLEAFDEGRGGRARRPYNCGAQCPWDRAVLVALGTAGNLLLCLGDLAQAGRVVLLRV